METRACLRAACSRGLAHDSVRGSFRYRTFLQFLSSRPPGRCLRLSRAPPLFLGPLFWTRRASRLRKARLALAALRMSPEWSQLQVAGRRVKGLATSNKEQQHFTADPKPPVPSDVSSRRSQLAKEHSDQSFTASLGRRAGDH